MAFEEKRAWIMLVVSICAYAVYLGIVLGRLGDSAVADVAYGATLLWTVGAAIVVSIVLGIVVGVASPKDAGKTDERDREIGRFGEYVGQSFVVIGSTSALVMAIFELDHFWIANTIYLMFFLSAVLGSVAKIVAYRKGFPSW